MECYKLIGYKHISGKSKKTGEPYDGYVLHVTIKSTDHGFIGEECLSPYADRPLVETAAGFPYQIGDPLDIRFDARGRVTGVTYGG